MFNLKCKKIPESMTNIQARGKHNMIEQPTNSSYKYGIIKNNNNGRLYVILEQKSTLDF